MLRTSAGSAPWSRAALGGMRTPAAVGFGAVWLLSAAVLAATGHGDMVPAAAIKLAIVGLFSLLVIAVTGQGAPDEPPGQPRRLWPQVAAILTFVILTGLGGMAFHGVLPGGLTRVPLWTPLFDLAHSLGLPAPTRVLNPLLLFLLPCAALLLLGARPAELGLRRGVRSGAAILAWTAPVLLFLMAQAVAGQPPSVMRLVKRAADNLVQNGLMEEFLFRGALQARLSRLWGGGWGLVLASLIFGLWHLGLAAGQMGGDYMAGAAAAILNQGAWGLAFGIAYQRTGSLLAPTVIHVVLNLV